LRPSRRHHDWIAQCAGSGEQRLEPQSVDAIVVGEKELHAIKSELMGEGTGRLIGLILRRHVTSM
jgi:hypothetical protein